MCNKQRNYSHFAHSKMSKLTYERTNSCSCRGCRKAKCKVSIGDRNLKFLSLTWPLSSLFDLSRSNIVSRETKKYYNSSIHAFYGIFDFWDLFILCHSQNRQRIKKASVDGDKLRWLPFWDGTRTDQLIYSPFLFTFWTTDEKKTFNVEERN